jgi:hypothetical protein
MFKGFIAWLDSYISREEPSAILKSLVGLMAFAGLLGTIFGNQAIRVGAFVLVIVFVVSVILLLLTDRRRLRREHDEYRKLLTRYSEFVIANSEEPLVAIEDWHQKVYIQPNGDVREVSVIRATALRDEVHFIRFHAGSRWEQPEKYRRKVQIRARGIKVNGFTGPHWHVTNTWLSDNKMKSIVHFESPVSKGEEIRLELVRFWPAKCLPLMRDGASDDFDVRTTKLLQLRRMEYQVILPPGFDAVYEPIGFTEPNKDMSVDAFTDGEGRKVITFRATRVPDRKTVGMRLELA